MRHPQIQRWAGLAVLLLAGLGATGPARGQGASREYVSQAGNYRVQMPGTPRIIQQQLSTKAGAQTLNMALVETPDKFAYTVIYNDFPEAMIRTAPVEGLFRGGVQGLQRTSGWTLGVQEPIKLGVHPGREIHFEVRDPKDPEGGIGRLRIILVGSRLYQVIMVGPKSKTRADDLARFLDSFALLKDVPKIANETGGVAMPPGRAMPGVAPSPKTPAIALMGRSGPDPSAPASAEVRASYDPARLIFRLPAGGFEKEAFRDLSPEPGGVLVGFRVGYVNAFNGAKIGWIRPIFQAGSAYVEGEQHGAEAAPAGEAAIVARPGYAVGALTVRTGLMVDAFQATFMKVANGRLDPRDAYTSPWVGEPNGGSPGVVSGEGRLAVGLLGRSNGQNVRALGLAFASGGTAGRPSPAARAGGSSATNAPDLGKPAEVPVEVSYDPAKLADSPSMPAGDREAFRELAPKGGVLVGLRVGLTNAGGVKVASVQPIFQAGTTYSLGQPRGLKSVRTTTVLARPGYAVGGLDLHAGLALDAVRVVFMKVEDGKLNPNDSYTSDWLGTPRATNPSSYSGRGRPVVGLIGRSNGREINALGMVLAR